MAEFIPKQYRKEQFTIRMEHDLLETVDQQAAKFKLSRSEFIVQCVQFALKHMPSEQ